MQEKKNLIVGLECILCLVANNTWDGKKIQNTETISYRASKQRHLKTRFTPYYQHTDIDNL